MKNKKQVFGLNRFLIFSFTLITVVLLSSCSRNITEVSVTDRIAETAFNQSPGTESNSIESIPYERTLFVPGANAGEGEEITLSGKINIAEQLLVDGHSFKLTCHVNPKSVTGLGLFTGNSYTISGGTPHTIAGTFKNKQFTGSIIEQLNVIGQGLPEKIVIESKFSIKITSDGKVFIKAYEE